jgi:hypothetical protein
MSPHFSNPFGVWRGSLLLGVLLIGAVTPAHGEQTNGVAALSYDSFRLISDRNIFNPNRYARSTTRTGTRPSSTRPAARVESFTLLGTMAYEKGVFAFFDGSSSDYRKALQAGEEIDGFRIARIAPEQIQLEAGTNVIELRVGMQMRREDEGDWFASTGDPRSSRRVASARARTSAGSGPDESERPADPTASAEPEVIIIEGDPMEETSETESPTPNGQNSDPQTENSGATADETDPVLLRLMQRRQQMNP